MPQASCERAEQTTVAEIMAEEWVWNTLDYGRPVTLRHLLCVDAVTCSFLAE